VCFVCLFVCLFVFVACSIVLLCVGLFLVRFASGRWSDRFCFSLLLLYYCCCFLLAINILLLLFVSLCLLLYAAWLLVSVRCFFAGFNVDCCLFCLLLVLCGLPVLLLLWFVYVALLFCVLFLLCYVLLYVYCYCFFVFLIFTIC